MSEQRMAVTISAPKELLERVDRIVEQAITSKKTLGRITRSSLIRSAVERGLDVIEKELLNDDV